MTRHWPAVFVGLVVVRMKAVRRQYGLWRSWRLSYISTLQLEQTRRMASSRVEAPTGHHRVGCDQEHEEPHATFGDAALRAWRRSLPEEDIRL